MFLGKRRNDDRATDSRTIDSAASDDAYRVASIEKERGKEG